MVTIEQKLLLFSKLLNQSMNKKFEDDLKELENQYNIKIQKNKEEADREANEVIRRGIRKAESKRNECISKSKTILKKEVNDLKEKHYNGFIENFKNTLQDFIQSEKYTLYLSKIIAELQKEINDYKDFELIIFLTQNDYEYHRDFIGQEITKYLNFKNISYEIKKDITGGLILEIPEKNLKIDMTLDTVLEDNKTYIMQTLFEALEAGEYNE